MSRTDSRILVASMMRLLSCQSWGDGSSSLHGRGPYALHFQLDVDAVADQDAARFEDLVPVQAEVLPVERGLRDEADPLVAPRVLRAPAVLDVQRNRPRHVADREIAGDTVTALRQRVDARAAEPELRKALGVEEVGGPQ